MIRKLVRILGLAVLAVVVLAMVGAVAFYYYDESKLAAQARATPQVPAEAATGRADPLVVDLPPDLNVASVHLLYGRDDVVVVDVRSEADYETGHVPGAMSAPADQLAARVQGLPRDATVIVTCRTGRSSAGAVDLLLGEGFASVHQMIGGMRAWRKAGFEVE